MNTALETPQGVLAALENLQVLLEQLRGQFVDGIKDAEGYARATVLLDELTDGHELNKYEERILVELEDAILAYEQGSSQFEAFNTEAKARATPVQLLKDLMDTLGLTGSDLPEIGDKTAVSKVLNGKVTISHKMAFALAERFHMDPKAFVQTEPTSSDLINVTIIGGGGSGVRFSRHVNIENLEFIGSPALRPVPAPFILTVHDDNKQAASSRKRPAKPTPLKG
jgi:HTH-type transcriptional regulator/antitoxin HigA